MKLTPRLRDVAALIALGWDTEAIAKELNISARMVRTYRSRIYATLEIPNPNHVWQRSSRQRIMLAKWWGCELFQVGMKELGLLDA